MSKNLVIRTNPYLKDPLEVIQGICKMVASSSAVEGIYVHIHAIPKGGLSVYRDATRDSKKIKFFILSGALNLQNCCLIQAHLSHRYYKLRL